MRIFSAFPLAAWWLAAAATDHRTPGSRERRLLVVCEPDACVLSLEDHWRQALAASKVRPRKFYATKHTFISVALTKRPNLKFIAEYCRTSVAMIEQHYGRFQARRVDDQLALLAGPSRAPARVSVIVITRFGIVISRFAS